MASGLGDVFGLLIVRTGVVVEQAAAAAATAAAAASAQGFADGRKVHPVAGEVWNANQQVADIVDQRLGFAVEVFAGGYRDNAVVDGIAQFGRSAADVVQAKFQSLAESYIAELYRDGLGLVDARSFEGLPVDENIRTAVVPQEVYEVGKSNLAEVDLLYLAVEPFVQLAVFLGLINLAGTEPLPASGQLFPVLGISNQVVPGNLRMSHVSRKFGSFEVASAGGAFLLLQDDALFHHSDIVQSPAII